MKEEASSDTCMHRVLVSASAVLLVICIKFEEPYTYLLVVTKVTADMVGSPLSLPKSHRGTDFP